MAASINKNDADKNDTIIVLDRKKSEIVTVPIRLISHLPSRPNHHNGKGHGNSNAATDKYYQLCDKVDPFLKTCRNEKKCHKVHLHGGIEALVGCQRKLIHINRVWRSLAECPYTRFHSGQTVQIREPSTAKSDVVDTVDTGHILFSRCVFDDPTRPATHCAHFYYGRECQMAHRCDFAHVVHINPKAESQQRAPHPSTFGRPRHSVDAASGATPRAADKASNAKDTDAVPDANSGVPDTMLSKKSPVVAAMWPPSIPVGSDQRSLHRDDDSNCYDHADDHQVQPVLGGEPAERACTDGEYRGGNQHHGQTRRQQATQHKKNRQVPAHVNPAANSPAFPAMPHLSFTPLTSTDNSQPHPYMMYPYAQIAESERLQQQPCMISSFLSMHQQQQHSAVGAHQLSGIQQGLPVVHIPPHVDLHQLLLASQHSDVLKSDDQTGTDTANINNTNNTNTTSNANFSCSTKLASADHRHSISSLLFSDSSASLLSLQLAAPQLYQQQQQKPHNQPPTTTATNAGMDVAFNSFSEGTPMHDFMPFFSSVNANNSGSTNNNASISANNNSNSINNNNTTASSNNNKTNNNTVSSPTTSAVFDAFAQALPHPKNAQAVPASSGATATQPASSNALPQPLLPPSLSPLSPICSPLTLIPYQHVEAPF